MDPMNGYFFPINGLEFVSGIQFSLCGTPTNLIFAHRDVLEWHFSRFLKKTKQKRNVHFDLNSVFSFSYKISFDDLRFLFMECITYTTSTHSSSYIVVHSS